MKKQFVFGVAIASVFAVLASAAPARAQQGDFVTQAAARLAKMVDAGNKAGFSLHQNSFSVGGGWLKQSKKNWVPLYTLELKEGVKYRFIAAGDDDARDVDIDVQDADGKTVAKDGSTDPTAMVEYTPPATGRYLVRVRLYASREGVDCVCAAIVMKHK